jgi:hypothetical protein
MKVFICEDHDGHCFNGTSVVVANDEKEAINLLDKILLECELRPYEEYSYTLKEVTDKPFAYMLNNGDAM